MRFIKSLFEWFSCKRCRKEDTELEGPGMSGVKESLERLKAEQAEKHKVRDRNNAILAGQKDNLDKESGRNA